MGDPGTCLGTELRKATLENGVKAWSNVSPSKHLQEKEPDRPWLKKVPTPFAKDCRPDEIDVSPEPGIEEASCCVSQIGVLLWMVKLEEWVQLQKHQRWQRS